MPVSKKKKPCFGLYIMRVLKQVHPDLGLSRRSKLIYDSFIYDIFNRIAKEAEQLMIRHNRMTMKANMIATASRLVLPGELAKHAQAEGTKSVNKFNSSIEKPNGPSSSSSSSSAKNGKGRKGIEKFYHRNKSKSERAGLSFPVTRFYRLLKSERYCNACSVSASVYMASIIEYLVAELLELSGNAAKDNKRVRIVPRHILLAIRNDDELGRLLAHVILPNAGVMPSFHQALLGKKWSNTMARKGKGMNAGPPNKGMLPVLKTDKEMSPVETKIDSVEERMEMDDEAVTTESSKKTMNEDGKSEKSTTNGTGWTWTGKSADPISSSKTSPFSWKFNPTPPSPDKSDSTKSKKSNEKMIEPPSPTSSSSSDDEPLVKKTGDSQKLTQSDMPFSFGGASIGPDTWAF